MSLTLGKYGSQWHGDGADVHKEEQTIEKASDKPPVARHSVLLLVVVQSTQVDPQVAVDVADLAFQTSNTGGLHPLCSATVQRAAVVQKDVGMLRRGRRSNAVDTGRCWLSSWRRASFTMIRQVATRVCVQQFRHTENVCQTVGRQLQQSPVRIPIYLLNLTP